MAGHVLVVDDDSDVLLAAELLLKRQVERVSCLEDVAQLPELLRREQVDLILLDMNFTLGENSGNQGFYWLDHVLHQHPDTPVVLMTAYAGVELAVNAIKAGATDFVIKPWSNEKLIATVHSALSLARERTQRRQLQSENSLLRASFNRSSDNLIGEAPSLRELLRKVSLCAPTQANVLILGENGSGKELLAREIHAQSARAAQIFMAVDLGAIAESLFEAELFGHKKGAYTGAHEARPGKLLAANGGTLFLDEIGNLPLHLQVKLLTVLEQRQVTPLGSEQAVAIDVRVIAATNAPYSQLTDETRFRQDLLYRLNTVELKVPPLRERRDDIPLLLDYYLGFYAQKYRRAKPTLKRSCWQALTAYDWPGNVRSLRHCVERALVLSPTDTLSIEDFALPASSPAATTSAGLSTLHLETLEKQAVSEALKKHQGNISRAAQELGLTRTALYRRMEKHEL